MESDKNFNLIEKKMLGDISQYYEICTSKKKKIGIITIENKDIHFLLYNEIKKNIKDITDQNLFKMGIMVFSIIKEDMNISGIADLVLNLLCKKYEVNYISDLRLRKDEIFEYIKSLELTSQEEEVWEYIKLYLGLNERIGSKV